MILVQYFWGREGELYLRECKGEMKSHQFKFMHIMCLWPGTDHSGMCTRHVVVVNIYMYGGLLDCIEAVLATMEGGYTQQKYHTTCDYIPGIKEL